MAENEHDETTSHEPTAKETVWSAWRQDIIDCITFFSRLPVPPFLGKMTEGMPDMPRATRAMPIVGLLLGLIALVPATLFDVLAFTAPLPALLLAAMTIATMAIVTGGLHEDGFSDVADGFWGGQTKERKMEIMKDSRLGAYGAIALMMSILIRVSILAYLFEHYGVQVGGIAYLVTCIASRVPILHVWYTLPAARKDGISASIGQPNGQSYAIGVAMGALVTAMGIVPFFGFLAALSAFTMLVLSAMLVVKVARKHLDGQTGDVLGSSQQLGEMAFGVGLLLFASAA